MLGCKTTYTLLGAVEYINVWDIRVTFARRVMRCLRESIMKWPKIPLDMCSLVAVKVGSGLLARETGGGGVTLRGEGGHSALLGTR